MENKNIEEEHIESGNQPEKNKKKIMIVIAMVITIFICLAILLLFIWDKSVVDSFSDTSKIDDIWNVQIDTTNGEVKLTEQSCDSSTWLCGSGYEDVCSSTLGDGDHIVVALADGPSLLLWSWKNTKTACDQPQCGQDGGQDGDNLVADNTVNFANYPARDACKRIGGRLPTATELECIFANRSTFGDNFDNQSYYWSSTENSETKARYVFRGIGHGRMVNYDKTNDRQVRCVLGLSSGYATRADYWTQGTMKSKNLLSGTEVKEIKEFGVTSVISANTAVSISFSRDGVNFYSSSGTKGDWDPCSDGITDIDLSGLGWSGGVLFYKLKLETTDSTATPTVSEVELTYKGGKVSEPGNPDYAEGTLAERSCDSSTWLCGSGYDDVCSNTLGDGDHIVVALADESSLLQWKNTKTACDQPQCGQYGGHGNNLVADNTVNFANYPARDACKRIGGRLPTATELQCIYANKSTFGDNFDDQGYYWSSTEGEGSAVSALAVHFSYGMKTLYTRSSNNLVRCVQGW